MTVPRGKDFGGPHVASAAGGIDDRRMTTNATVSTKDGYVITRSDEETQRLARQSDIFAVPTKALLDAVGLAQGDSALDVGCGGGDVMREMGARVGPTGLVTGLDLDGALASDAVARLRRDGAARFSYVQGDVLEADLPTAGFDVVFARFLLIHLRNPVAALRRMWSWTAPGGHIAALDYDFRTLRGQGSRAVECLDGLVAEVFAATGLDTRFGGSLPTCFERAAIGVPDGTSVAGQVVALDEIAPFLASTYRAFLPAAKRLGIENERRTRDFNGALESETRGERRYIVGPLIVAAWKRRRAEEPRS